MHNEWPGFLSLSAPVVSFSFDDFPRSALWNGGAILKANGICGTYYAAMGLIGANMATGEQFHRGDLDALLQDGHELASHTYSHVSSHKSTPQSYGEEVLRGQKAVEQITGRSGPQSFAYPFGHIAMGVRGEIAGKVSSARSVWGGLNGPWLDLSRLRACSIYGGREAFPALSVLIRRNANRKRWLIFYTHDVSRTPSRFGCTPELFDMVVQLSLQCATMRTIGEVTATISSGRKTARNALLAS
jgi:peptidoglycan/xylan/chitin deacetylase (PgdA/CDA1 family)